MSNQNNRLAKNHRIVLHNTCNNQTIIVFDHNHWIVAGLNSVQIINNRNTIHT
nr:hypothetical protein [bacterium]